MAATDASLTDTPMDHPAWMRRVFESDSAEPDLDRVRRVGARFLGLGFIGYPLVSITQIVAAAPLTAPWWPPVSILLSVGPGILLILASFRPGTAWLGPLALTTWGGYLLGVALWFMAWNGMPLADPGDSAQWMIAFCGMPSMVLMLIHTRLGLISLAVSSLVANISQQLGRFGAVNADLALEIVWSFVFTGVFLSVVLVAIRTGRMLDETREATYRAAANAAATSARDVEQARIDAIVHDRVIASLLAVEPGRPDARLAAQARSALEELARVPTPSEPVAGSARDAIRRMRSAAADISERFDVEVVMDETDDGLIVYPAEVVDAVVEAMSEALRNALRHAGPDADCAAIVHIAPDSLSMAVVDNGTGFDPGSVAPGRLGIVVSIRGRLARIPGGRAHVSSRPGRGTTVSITWERP
ncbi:ATP-binding protein [Gordonia alkanivorans]|uniref:sensor histidine kinase n=1 Tax=Gordonia alkanivorans TaxID=84096 RepID=UPI00244C0C78|nr:ATP-binding protein [Gordonia alkanivorans]MDH3024082.1 ATP-binding protein [Gordonia alkanivorans]